MSQLKLTLINWENKESSPLFQELIDAYTRDFWAGAWKELLAEKDATGKITAQYGTFGADGKIYRETLEILANARISPQDPAWAEKLWRLAGNGTLHTPSGAKLTQYWSTEAAKQELAMFLAPQNQAGLNGEILILTDSKKIIGFTAYACQAKKDGLAIADARFPVERLYIPIQAEEPTDIKLSEAISKEYKDHLSRIGVFLDHAIEENQRGKGYGSRLFDARIKALQSKGATLIIGRTILSSPAQYNGNYKKRGLAPFAADATNEFSGQKHYFAAKTEDLRERSK